MEDIRLENLGSGVTAVISREHGFGTDALLLADFADVSVGDKCCDLGTGCGIIPLLWCRKNLKNPISAVEISSRACAQLDQALEISSLCGKVEVFNRDIREIKEFLPSGYFDVVTMNPPYKAQGAGIVSSDDIAAVARHGVMCSLEDMCQAASWLVRFGGKFCVCLRPERLCELMCCMSKFGLEPKRLRTVSKKDGSAPWLVLVEGKRGAKPGITVEPQLNVYAQDSQYSEYMKALYADYERERSVNMSRRGENKK